MSDKNEVKVRFGPSPTGPLHIGGIRTALYNYAFAKKHNGKFFLRIEDTDKKRSVKSSEKYIKDSLEWLGIPADEFSFRQSERKEVYHSYIEYLLNNGHAYYAFDTEEDLNKMREDFKRMKKLFKYNIHTREKMKNSLSLSESEVNKRISNGEPYVIRLRTPRDKEIKVFDEIRGWIKVDTRELDDKVLLKEDGMPTYHLANVVDDKEMGISHVIRGEEWLPSLPFHVLLYEFINGSLEEPKDSMPKFAHLPLIVKPDDKKISKRDLRINDTNSEKGVPVLPLEWKDEEGIMPGCKEEGFFPEAILNILMLLGWNPGNEKEFFTKNEFISYFSLDKVNKSGAKFDVNKAFWFNKQHLNNKNDKELAETIEKKIKERYGSVRSEYLVKFCSIFKEKCTFLEDLLKGDYFFRDPEDLDEKMIEKKWGPEVSSLMDEFLSKLKSIEDFSADNVKNETQNFINEKNIKFGKIAGALRLLLTGTSVGPAIFDIAETLGKETTITRIEKMKEKLEKYNYKTS